MVVPPFHTPKWSFFVGKPMGLLGKPSILGNQYVGTVSSPFQFCNWFNIWLPEVISDTSPPPVGGSPISAAKGTVHWVQTKPPQVATSSHKKCKVWSQQFENLDFRSIYQVIQAVTFLSSSWRSLNLWKGHLTIPKKSQRLARWVMIPY